MSIAPGTKLGQYEVQDFIGQGAMGLVYRAYHPQLERTGAVKVLQSIAPDPDTTARFRHEAQAIAQMRHPNILNVYDFGEYQGMPYMIVEYVPGGSLANRLSQGLLDQPAALRYLRGIASGLDYAHGLGVVHRDVKPANVLLETDDTPVLADFGLAKLMQGSSLKSISGVTTGTPAYMSPEQVTGSQVGPPADRYSLATIAYEMLTGVIPFDGEGVLELLYAQVHREPPLPSARNARLGPRLDAVVMRGLAKDPNARWGSCTAFVDALAAALAQAAPAAVEQTVAMAPAVASTMPLAALAAAAEVPPAPRAAPSPSATVAVAYPAPATAAAKPKSRRGWFALAAAAVIVLLLLLAIGVNAAAHPQPTLSLSATTVRAGGTVTVSAAHVPAGQSGEIQLLSTIHLFPFVAGSSGNVSVPITVPRDIGIGDHTVRICWASQCHASATLHVIEPLALRTPTAGATPTATPSPGAGPSPSPGVSAPPTATTGASPKPASSPKASPTPPPPPAPSITLSASSVKVGGSITVYGFHFGPGQTATISLIQATSTTVGTAPVKSDGSFTAPVTILAAVPGPATIRACTSSGCASQAVTVTLT
ncbi:serine/threonine protein kinase [bacterium]|nr:MAG: serine/threonine protein kinase [bacterium]